jgi:urease accessory protein
VNSWPLIHLVESAFPAGGFAQPAALEAASRLGQLRALPDLAAFVEEALWASGSFGLPFVRAARAAPSLLPSIDLRCEAATRGDAGRRASRARGEAFLRAAEGFSPRTAELVNRIRACRLPGHLAPAFGAVLGVLGAGEEDASRLFLFLGARGILASAARLHLVGPADAQLLLARVAPAMNAILLACRAGTPTFAARAPAAELHAAHEARLRGRFRRPAAAHPPALAVRVFVAPSAPRLPSVARVVRPARPSRPPRRRPTPLPARPLARPGSSPAIPAGGRTVH